MKPLPRSTQEGGASLRTPDSKVSDRIQTKVGLAPLHFRPTSTSNRSKGLSEYKLIEVSLEDLEGSAKEKTVAL